jgi:hypothetical protein
MGGRVAFLRNEILVLGSSGTQKLYRRLSCMLRSLILLVTFPNAALSGLKSTLSQFGWFSQLNNSVGIAACVDHGKESP